MTQHGEDISEAAERIMQGRLAAHWDTALWVEDNPADVLLFPIARNHGLKGGKRAICVVINFVPIKLFRGPWHDRFSMPFALCCADRASRDVVIDLRCGIAEFLQNFPRVAAWHWRWCAQTHRCVG
jgi:hypothetical protein